ncbi:MAG: UPF0104 family protein [Planctomycetota bacterium]|nr:MAG: UPF0104 family protein [Planctomycetota bacterium]
MKKHAIQVVKWAISLAIIAFVVYRVMEEDPQTFSRFRNEPKDWSLLALAFVLLATSVTLTFVRWFWLVRALGLPFRLADAMRLGYIGYMFNLVSLGSVGGDLFKAVFLAREQPTRKTEAVATIFVDRFIGLYGMLILATIVFANLDLAIFGVKATNLAAIRVFTFAATAVVTACFAALLLPYFLRGPIIDWFCNIPKIGSTIRRLVDAALVYRRERSVLLACVLLTVGVHCLNVTVFYLCSEALLEKAPPLVKQFAIVPIGLLSSAIPLPAGALGAFEATMNYLYGTISDIQPPPAGQGLLVTLAWRLLSVILALVGVVYYLRGRKQMDEAYHAAELEEEGLPDPADDIPAAATKSDVVTP